MGWCSKLVFEFDIPKAQQASQAPAKSNAPTLFSSICLSLDELNEHAVVCDLAGDVRRVIVRGLEPDEAEGAEGARRAVVDGVVDRVALDVELQLRRRQHALAPLGDGQLAPLQCVDGPPQP